jgi:hypothetical protein
MGYDILSNSGKYFGCQQCTWPNYLRIATAFGWISAGAFFKNDEGGFGAHPSGSYLGNDWQQVTDDDARAFGAALKLAIAMINAGLPLTDDQITKLKEFEFDDSDPFADVDLTEEARVGLGKIKDEYLAEHPNEIRTIRTRYKTFDVNLRGIIDLAEVVSDGGFTIA